MFTQKASTRRLMLWIVVIGVLGALSLSACTVAAPAAQPAAAAPAQVDEESQASELPEITITASDFAFDLPAEIPSGWVSLTLTNEGQVNHHGIVMRLLDGVSVDDALAAMDNPDADQSEYSDLQFFLPDTGPGLSNQATVEMAPGHWVIFSVSMDGVSIGASEEPMPDFLLGSIQEFDVSEEGSMASPPEADLTLTIGADDVDVPEEIAAGPHTIEIVNDSGADNGYALILKMEDGATMEDVLAAFDVFFSSLDSGEEVDLSTMPDFAPVGGLMSYNLGDRYFTNVNLEPGNYTVVTSINANDFPYSGYSKDFTVPGNEAASGDGASSTEEIPELLIEVSEDGIMAPADVPGGIVHVTIDNSGEQEHTVDLWRIKEGYTRDDVMALNEHIKDNPDDFFGAFEIGNWVHYADGIEPGATRDYYVDLGTGDFFLSDDSLPEPVFFSANEVVGVVEPEAAVSVDMADFSYAMPDAIPAGEQLWQFTNSGTQWHLAAIIGANPDASLADIEAAFDDENDSSNDSAVQIYGGMPPMSPGERVWMAIDLEPGAYEVVCPLPDLGSLMNGDGPPVSHLEHGMRHAFQVENQ